MLNNLRGWHIGPCSFQGPMHLQVAHEIRRKGLLHVKEGHKKQCNQHASGCLGGGSKQDTGRLQPLGITCHVLSSSPAASVKKIHKIQGNPQHSSKPANQCVRLWFHLSSILPLWTWALCCTRRSVGVQLHTSPGSHLCHTHVGGLERNTYFDTHHRQSVIPTLGRSPIQQSLKLTLNICVVLSA